MGSLHVCVPPCQLAARRPPPACGPSAGRATLSARVRTHLCVSVHVHIGSLYVCVCVRVRACVRVVWARVRVHVRAGVCGGAWCVVCALSWGARAHVAQTKGAEGG